LRNAGRGTDWIVLLEACSGDRSTIDARRFHRLVASFGPVAPATLFSPDRYVLQLVVRAVDTVSALSTAIARWQRALRRCDLPHWPLVRAEVMTPAELEAELDGVDAEPGGLYAEAWVPAPHQEIDAMEEELLRRALFDSVTGLPSRALFLDEVRGVVEAGPAAPAVPTVVAVRVAVPTRRPGVTGRRPTRCWPRSPAGWKPWCGQATSSPASRRSTSRCSWRSGRTTMSTGWPAASSTVSAGRPWWVLTPRWWPGPASPWFGAGRLPTGSCGPPSWRRGTRRSRPDGGTVLWCDLEPGAGWRPAGNIA
jgi:hypothetical protein